MIASRCHPNYNYRKVIMRKAVDASIQELLPATTNVVDRLLASINMLPSRPNYVGDMSNTITGYEGIRVVLFRDGGGGINLQVNGPAPLVEAIIKYCAGHDMKPRPDGRSDRHVVFPVA
jgi:hypothetical protein